MSIPPDLVSQLEGVILGAFQGIVTQASGQEKSDIESQAKAFAQFTTSIGLALAAGQIDKPTAQSLVQVHIDLAEAELAGDAGRVATQAQPLVMAALKSCAGLGLDALGLGPLAQVLDAVLAARTAAG
jgi:hypothetical protein